MNNYLNNKFFIEEKKKMIILIRHLYEINKIYSKKKK